MKPKAGKEYKGDYKDAAAVHGIQDPAVFDEVSSRAPNPETRDLKLCTALARAVFEESEP